MPPFTPRVHVNRATALTQRPVWIVALLAADFDAFLVDVKVRLGHTFG